jgi:hypothetical protein
MALADRTPPPARKGPGCTVCWLHRQLKPEDQVEFTRLLDETTLTANQILTLLAEEGYDVSWLQAQILRRHRIRECWGRLHGSV